MPTSYTPTTYVDGSSPWLEATNLNKAENAIAALASEKIEKAGDTMTGELRFADRLRSDTVGEYPTTGWLDQSHTWIRQRFQAPTAEGFLPANIFSLVETEGATSFGERRAGMTVHMRDHTTVNELNVTGATNASPIVITTDAAHGYVDGRRILVWNVGGNTNANGIYYVDVLSTTTFALYTDIALTTPRAGNAGYTSGGKVSNRSIMYGLDVAVFPQVARTQLASPIQFYDDINCFVGHNSGTGKATDAYYLGRNSTGFPGAASEWVSGFLTDANTDYAFRTTGSGVNGLRLDEGTFTGLAVKLGVGDKIGSRNNANSADIDLVRLNTTDQWVLAEGGQSIALWGATATPANSGGRVLHLQSSSQTVPVELRLENTATQGFADMNLFSKTSGGVVVRVRLYANEFQGWIGTQSNHNMKFGVNGVDRFEFGTSGGFAVRNTANTAYVFTVFDSGNVQMFDGANILLGTTTGTKIGTLATQKIGLWGATPVVRPTGWGAPTGTATRTAFSTDSVTVQGVAERLKALIDDLTTTGNIGA